MESADQLAAATHIWLDYYSNWHFENANYTSARAAPDPVRIDWGLIARLEEEKKNLLAAVIFWINSN